MRQMCIKDPEPVLGPVLPEVGHLTVVEASWSDGGRGRDRRSRRALSSGDGSSSSGGGCTNDLCKPLWGKRIDLRMRARTNRRRSDIVGGRDVVSVILDFTGKIIRASINISVTSSVNLFFSSSMNIRANLKLTTGRDITVPSIKLMQSSVVLTETLDEIRLLGRDSGSSSGSSCDSWGNTGGLLLVAAGFGECTTILRL